MKFKLDENLPAELNPLLRQRGHEAHSVRDEHLEGSPDEAIAQTCHSEQRILITLDLDFADIRLYPPEESPGIIVLRLSRQDKAPAGLSSSTRVNDIEIHKGISHSFLLLRHRIQLIACTLLHRVNVAASRSGSSQ